MFTEQCEIEEVALSVGASGVGLGAARAVAARWRVCGAVTPPEPQPRRVLLAPGDSAPVYVTPGPDGELTHSFIPGFNSRKSVL